MKAARKAAMDEGQAGGGGWVYLTLVFNPVGLVGGYRRDHFER